MIFDLIHPTNNILFFITSLNIIVNKNKITNFHIHEIITDGNIEDNVILYRYYAHSRK